MKAGNPVACRARHGWPLRYGALQTTYRAGDYTASEVPARSLVSIHMTIEARQALTPYSR